MPQSRPRKTSGGSATAFQQIQNQLKWVDLVIEVRDARLPESSRHPQCDSLFANKPKVVVLAKEDLADPVLLRQWLAGNSPQAAYLALDLKYNRGKDKLIDAALKLTEARRAQLAGKGLLPRPMRGCVVGMPNVGKSSLINWLIGRKKAAVGDRPGITRGQQWVRLHPQLELLDTPGILPPVAFSEPTTLKLSLLNLLSEHSYDFEEVARLGLELLTGLYPAALSTYHLPEGGEPTLEGIAAERKWLTAGGYPDSRRAAQMFLRDLRAGTLGRITLDRPEQT